MSNYLTFPGRRNNNRKQEIAFFCPNELRVSCLKVYALGKLLGDYQDCRNFFFLSLSCYLILWWIRVLYLVSHLATTRLEHKYAFIYLRNVTDQWEAEEMNIRLFLFLHFFVYLIIHNAINCLIVSVSFQHTCWFRSKERTFVLESARKIRDAVMAWGKIPSLS